MIAGRDALSRHLKRTAALALLLALTPAAAAAQQGRLVTGNWTRGLVGGWGHSWTPGYGKALVHESKLARHGPNHRCFIDRRRRKLGGPYRSSHSAYCMRAALRPFSHRVSWLEDHRR